MISSLRVSPDFSGSTISAFNGGSVSPPGRASLGFESPPSVVVSAEASASSGAGSGIADHDSMTPSELKDGSTHILTNSAPVRRYQDHVGFVGRCRIVVSFQQSGEVNQSPDA